MSFSISTEKTSRMSDKHNQGEIYHSVKLINRFEWTIRDLSFHKIYPRIVSPGVSFSTDTWHLALCVCEPVSEKGWLNLQLWRTKTSGPLFQVKVGVKNGDCEDLSFTAKTNPKGYFEVNRFLPPLEILKKGNLLVSSGNLTIFCEMWEVDTKYKSPMLKDLQTTVETIMATINTKRKVQEIGKRKKEPHDTGKVYTKEREPDLEVPKTCTSLAMPTVIGEGDNRLVQDLRNLLRDGQNSDVIMKVKGKEFKVHKAILVARCPAFASMFQHDTGKKNNIVIDIPDCSTEAFTVFLHYLYVGRLEDFSIQDVYNLYYAADNFGMEYVKEHCVKFLKTEMCIDNFYDIISLSLRYNDTELLETATQFFSENMESIITTVRWQEFIKENPMHANELYVKVLMN